jgi:hypothetical protein
VKERPRFIVDSSHGFDATPGAIPEHHLRVAINDDEVLQASKRKEPVLRS